jgi:hypothetical protein
MKNPILPEQFAPRTEASRFFWQIIFVLGLCVGIGIGSFYIGKSVGDFVVSIVPGDNIAVDNANPKHPIVSTIGSGFYRRRYIFDFPTINSGTPIVVQTYTQEELLIGFNIRNTLCTNFEGGFGGIGLRAAFGGNTDNNKNVFMVMGNGDAGVLTSLGPDFPSEFETSVDFVEFSPDTPMVLINTGGYTDGDPDSYTSGVFVIDVITAKY